LNRFKSDGTRRRILEVALALFRGQGFKETSMREIGAAAGGATSSTCYCFDSKEALVLAFYQRAQDELEPLLRNSGRAARTLEGRLRTRAIGERDISIFAEALEAGRNIPKDLRAELPRILWFYQMALILFWIYDRSPEQKQTAKLLNASLPLVVSLIGLASLPLTRPIRKRVLTVVRILAGDI
jgi:AcrR family transcriptional regulator